MLQKNRTMAREPLRILLIQPWGVPGEDVRDALRAGGFEPTIHRVDHEAALYAALGRGDFEVVIFDASVGIRRAAVVALLQGVRVPLIDLVRGPALADAVRAAVGALRN